MVLGFGEAGNSLLSKILYTKNFNEDFLENSDLVYAIYGFCDIRNFTDATEILKEDVLVFVNEIADVVFEEVGLTEGGANKNIGDAFLVVWKLFNSEDSNIKDMLDPSKSQSLRRTLYMENKTIEANPLLRQKSINDQLNFSKTENSLIAFLKIIARIAVDEKITIYNSNKLLLKYLPGFTVNIGFGLHLGWSLEGAIGSIFKIDMSYLSPNVNMSSRLEGLTKTYKKKLLFTDNIYVMLKSNKIRELCRLIDIIHVSGSDYPTEIFTVDLHIVEL